MPLYVQHAVDCKILVIGSFVTAGMLHCESTNLSSPAHAVSIKTSLVHIQNTGTAFTCINKRITMPLPVYKTIPCMRTPLQTPETKRHLLRFWVHTDNNPRPIAKHYAPRSSVLPEGGFRVPEGSKLRLPLYPYSRHDGQGQS